MNLRKLGAAQVSHVGSPAVESCFQTDASLIRMAIEVWGFQDWNTGGGPSHVTCRDSTGLFEAGMGKDGKRKCMINMMLTTHHWHVDAMFFWEKKQARSNYLRWPVIWHRENGSLMHCLQLLNMMIFHEVISPWTTGWSEAQRFHRYSWDASTFTLVTSNALVTAFSSFIQYLAKHTGIYIYLYIYIYTNILHILDIHILHIIHILHDIHHAHHFHYVHHLPHLHPVHHIHHLYAYVASYTYIDHVHTYIMYIHQIQRYMIDRQTDI